MTEYPKIQRILASCDSAGDRHSFTMDKPYWTALATELRALLAERDALKAKVPQPVRKLREVKIDCYDDLYRWNNGKLEASVGNPRRWAVQHHILTEWIDAVTALRDDPYEPVETVEDVLREMCDYSRRLENVPKYATRLRAAVAAEGVRDV